MENKKNSDSKLSQENGQEGSHKSSQGSTSGSQHATGGQQQGQKSGSSASSHEGAYTVGAGNQAADDETEGLGVSGTRTAHSSDEENGTTGGKSYSSRAGQISDEEGKDPRRMEAGKKGAETKTQSSTSGDSQKGGNHSQKSNGNHAGSSR